MISFGLMVKTVFRVIAEFITACSVWQNIRCFIQTYAFHLTFLGIYIYMYIFLQIQAIINIFIKTKTLLNTVAREVIETGICRKAMK